MKRNLKCKKCYGKWQYEKIMPDDYNDLDAPIYELYVLEKSHLMKNTDFYKKYFDGIEFGCYSDMKYFVETGVILA